MYGQSTSTCCLCLCFFWFIKTRTHTRIHTVYTCVETCLDRKPNLLNEFTVFIRLFFGTFLSRVSKFGTHAAEKLNTLSVSNSIPSAKFLSTQRHVQQGLGYSHDGGHFVWLLTTPFPFWNAWGGGHVGRMEE